MNHPIPNHNSATKYCKPLGELSSIAYKVIHDETETKDFKQLLSKCIDTLSIYKAESRKIECITKDTPRGQVIELYESLYVYFKIVSQIASQVIPSLKEFQKAKVNAKNDSNYKELMGIYSKLVSALATDKLIAGIKKFLKDNSEDVSPTTIIEQIRNEDYVNVNQLHVLIRHDSALENVLLIDVRPRMIFSKEHIKFQNLICIEPISFKEHYTDIELLRKSLITAPDKEVSLFKHRGQFPLIVLYTDEGDCTRYYQQQLHSLKKILVYRSFDTPLDKSKVVELRNGLEEWKKKFPAELVESLDSNTGTLAPNLPGNNAPFQASIPRVAEIQHNLFSSGSRPSFTEYPKTPFLSDGKTPMSVGLAPPKVLPSTSSLTRILQEEGVSKSDYNLPSKIGNKAIKTNGFAAANSDAKLDLKKLNITVGLVNLGNSCYLNCIVQCLLGCHELSYIFLTNSYKKHVNVKSRLGSKGVLANYFAQLIQQMYCQSKSNSKSTVALESMAVQPSQFKMACGSVNSLFKDSQQQDCQEFCQFLLDGLHEDLNQCGNNPPLRELSPEAEKMRESMPMRIASAIEWERYLTTDFSVVVDLFQGQYASRLRCNTCSHTSTTYQAFSVLSVPVPKTNTCTIYDCFKEFTKLETLEKEELWNCPVCKAKRPSSKQIIITRLPNNLIIHLKRFDNMLNKNNVFVNYPDELDLTKFWVNDYNGNMPMENGIVLPLRGQKPPFHYRLFAVASHSGTLYGGHYTSFVDKNELGWCSFDDMSWRKVKTRNEYLTPNAYVLFYRRVHS